MSARAGLRGFIVLLLLVAVVLGHRTCSDRRASANPAAQAGQAGMADVPTARAAPLGALDDDARRRHADALRSAVSTLHAYIAALPEDRVRADAFWLDGAPPPGAREADLRTLPKPPRALRVQNRAPRALDAGAMPAEVEIEVELRLHLDAPPPRRYAGTYRLRRIDGAGAGGDSDEWRLLDAAIDALPPPR